MASLPGSLGSLTGAPEDCWPGLGAPCERSERSGEAGHAPPTPASPDRSLRSHPTPLLTLTIVLSSVGPVPRYSTEPVSSRAYGGLSQFICFCQLFPRALAASGD